MDWKIERIRDRCAECAAPFVHDQRVFSVVDLALVDNAERIVRRDLCARCGANRGAPGSPASRALWWETRFQQQAPKKKKVDFDRLLRIFETWQKAPPKEQEALLYLITLLLVRKRYLRMVDLVTDGGREMLRLRKPGAAEQWYFTPAPLLTPADLPALRIQLEELIDGSFAEEEMPSSTDAQAAAEA
jgi:hypothetical protein